jgi:hypothetical protein
VKSGLQAMDVRFVVIFAVGELVELRHPVVCGGGRQIRLHGEPRGLLGARPGMLRLVHGGQPLRAGAAAAIPQLPDPQLDLGDTLSRLSGPRTGRLDTGSDHFAVSLFHTSSMRPAGRWA